MIMEINSAYKEYIDEFQRFTEWYVKPAAAMTDEKEEFPLLAIRKLAKSSWLGFGIAEDWGGKGKDMMPFVLLVEELSKACASTGVIDHRI